MSARSARTARAASSPRQRPRSPARCSPTSPRTTQQARTGGAALADTLRAALTGRYAVERELGRGGMAVVYLARDLRHARRVAVKVLERDIAPASAEGFLREIAVTAALQHPHVLPLHDSGEADGLLYYVMPYVEGETLRARLAREGALSVADAARLLRELADALAYAHGAGVVHRDLKPENVLLSGDTRSSRTSASRRPSPPRGTARRRTARRRTESAPRRTQR